MKKYNTQKGYALLFTLVIVSVIMTIATGVANGFYKQLILSSTASDSQIAFYQADTAAECGIYFAQNFDPLDPNPPSTIECGYDRNDTPITLNVSTTSSVPPALPLTEHTLDPANSTLTGPCFRIDITDSPIVNESEIRAFGWNSCLATDARKIERGVEITY